MTVRSKYVSKLTYNGGVDLESFILEQERLDELWKDKSGRICLSPEMNISDPYVFFGTSVPQTLYLNNLNEMMYSEESQFNRSFITWGENSEIVGVIVSHVTILELDKICYTVVFINTKLGKQVEKLICNDMRGYEIELENVCSGQGILLSKLKMVDKDDLEVK